MKNNFLKKIFHAPDYLSLSAAGIEICNKSIKYTEFIDDNREILIKSIGELPILAGSMKEGNILNRDNIVDTLNSIKKKLSYDFMKASIPEEKTYIFDVQISKAAKNNLREALSYKIEENVPLKLEESYFEYEIVDEDFNQSDMIVNVSVISKRVIADYTELFELSDLFPVSFEVESKVLAKSVIGEQDKKNVIILNIKDDSTILACVINGFVRVSSSISIGENNIVETLFKTNLFKEKKDINKFFQSDFSFETVYTKESYLSLINIFSIYKDEVEKVNEYIVNKFSNTKLFSDGKIDKIILCGKCSTLPGLAKHINQNIRTEVVLANIMNNICNIEKCTYNITFQEALNFVTPIGLATTANKQ